MKIKIKTNKLSKEELQAYLHHKKSAHKHKSKKDYRDSRIYDSICS